ncbi:MAG: molybdopterin molybdotransferase MoeA [Actinobacteria bacterium]|nr:molybdopterin molybdotransferase MoeA [Actinomycetota bacterium]
MGRTEVVDPEELEPVDSYRHRILDEVQPLEAIELGLSDVLDLVLAEDVVSEGSLPAFDNSAMDGYAVVAADAAGASGSAPVTLPVAGEVPAGSGVPPRLEPGTAVRIMTGAPVPSGADAVVPVEVTRRTDGRAIEVLRAPAPGEHIRRVGEDLQVGERILRTGRRLRPGDIAMLASLGRGRVRCHPRPRVVVLSTGSEIVRPDQEPGPGMIRDANGPLLSALVRQADAVPFWSGIVPDDRKALVDAFDSNLGHADVLITTGGVSAGTHDHVRDVVAMLGDRSHRAKVAMKPGMPQLFGHARGVPIFGLPGNPVSAFVSFEVFVRPALRRMQGRRDIDRPIVTARLEEPIETPPHKRTYIRVSLRQDGGRWLARPAGGQGSHQVATLVATDGLAEIPEDRTTVRAGEAVRVHLVVAP